MNLRPRQATVVVFIVFCLIAVSAAVASQHVVRQEETRLVAERAADVGEELTNSATGTDASLRSLATLASLPGAATSFTAEATPLLAGAARTIALIARHGASFTVEDAVGDTSTLGSTLSPSRIALLHQAFLKPDMVSAVLHNGYDRRLGFALALPPDQGSLVVYEENAINPIDVPSSPAYQGMDVAIYAASSARPAMLAESVGSTAFTPGQYVAHIAVGAGQWTLIVHPTRPCRACSPRPSRGCSWPVAWSPPSWRPPW
jgi:hypothetical protein